MVQMECSEWSPCLCSTKVPPPAGKEGHVERSPHTIHTTIFQRLPLSHTPHPPSFSFFFLFISFSPPHTPQPLSASHHPPLSIATVRHCQLAIRSSIVLKKLGKFPFYFIFLSLIFFIILVCTIIDLDLGLLLIGYLFGLIGLGLRHYFIWSYVLLMLAC